MTKMKARRVMAGGLYGRRRVDSARAETTTVTPRRIVALAACGALAGAAALAVFRADRPAAPGERFRPPAVPGQDLVLMPEAQRTFARVVLGLRPHGASRRNALRGAADPRAATSADSFSASTSSSPTARA